MEKWLECSNTVLSITIRAAFPGGYVHSFCQSLATFNKATWKVHKPCAVLERLCTLNRVDGTSDLALLIIALYAHA